MLDYEELPCSGAPRAIVLWLHGLGADGFDLQPAAELLEVPGLRHVFPHAPVRPVSINAGMAMRAWYDIAAADLRWQEDSAGMREAAQQVGELAEALRGDAGLPLVLAGFSQGAVISLIAAAAGLPGLAGVATLSGYVPQFLLPALGRLRGLPLFMAHGEDDGVIPFALAENGREMLAHSGVDLAWHAYPMTHTLCQQELADLAGWLRALPDVGGG